MLGRRGLLGVLLAAPVIIRTPGLLMPVKKVVLPSSTMVTIDWVQPGIPPLAYQVQFSPAGSGIWQTTEWSSDIWGITRLEANESYDFRAYGREP